MDTDSARREGESSATIHREGQTSLLAGVEVRSEDVEEQPGLHVAGVVFRIASVVIVLLAIYQGYDWLRDPPPGGAGMSVLIGDTVRLVVIAFLLYGAADLADVVVKNHYELRATRILLARQTYLMRHVELGGGDTLPMEAKANRRGRPSGRMTSIADDDDVTQGG